MKGLNDASDKKTRLSARSATADASRRSTSPKFAPVSVRRRSSGRTSNVAKNAPQTSAATSSWMSQPFSTKPEAPR